MKIFLPLIIILTVVILNLTNRMFWGSTEFLTFMMVVLTYFYVVFTWETLERLKMESYLERRPYFITDFESERSSDLSIYIENTGKSPARNVKVRLEPDIVKANNTSLNDTIFKDPIDFYPPGKKVETFLNTTQVFFRENPDKFKVYLEYEDYFGKRFKEEYILDLNHHKNQTYIVEKNLGHVVSSLEKLTKVILSKK